MNLKKNCVIYLFAIQMVRASFFQVNPVKNYLVMDFMKVLTEKLKEHSSVLHIDNTTLNVADEILKDVNDFVVYNHDRSAVTKRYAQGRFINIVLLKHNNSFGRIRSNTDVSFKNVLLLTYFEEDLQTYTKWNIRYFNKFGHILVMNISYPTIEIRQVCGPYSRKWQTEHVDLTINDTKEIYMDQLGSKCSKNFFGDKLNVKFVNSFPYVYKYVRNNQVKIRGVHKRMLDTLSKKLNFTYDISAVENYSDWLATALKANYDVAIGGIRMTSERLQSSQMLYLKSEPIAFIYVNQETLWEKLTLIFRPFHYWVWITIIFTMTVLSITWYVVLRFVYKLHHFTMLMSVQNIVKTVMEQPLNCRRCRRVHYVNFFIVVLWWFTCLQLDTSYKSKLTSMLIHSQAKSVEDISDLLHRGYKICINEEKHYGLSGVLESIDISDESVVQHKSLCESFQYITENKCALLGPYKEIFYETQMWCRHSNRFSKDIKIIPSSVARLDFGWAFRSDAPFTIAFERQISKLLEGLVLKWEKDNLFRSTLRTSSRNFKKFNINYKPLCPYFTHFAIYFIGITLAGLCFVGEVTYVNFVKMFL